MSVYYKELQKFTQIWLWAILIISMIPIIGFTTYGLVMQLIKGVPWGDTPTSDTGLILITMFAWLICGGITLMLIFAKLQVEIKDRAVYYFFTFFSPRLKKVGLEEIESWEIKKFSFFEYGGYGVRHRPGKKTAFIVKGKMGLELKLKEGKTILLGTQRPEEIKASMQSEWDRYNNKGLDG